MQEKAFLWGCVVGATPELVVDVRTVEQCSHYILVGTHVSKNQTDPVQRRQQKENKCQKEIAVIGLPHTAVDPNTNQNDKQDTKLRSGDHFHISVTQSEENAEGEITSLSPLHICLHEEQDILQLCWTPQSLINAY